MEATDPSPIMMIGVVLGFCVVFPLIWGTVCFLISAMGGWRDLSGRFRTETPPPPNARLLASARLGWANYRSTIRIARVGESLHLSVLGIFRIGHPHLQIPLEAVRVEEKSGVLGRRVTLHIGSFAELTLRAAEWDEVQG